VFYEVLGAGAEDDNLQEVEVFWSAAGTQEQERLTVFIPQAEATMGLVAAAVKRQIGCSEDVVVRMADTYGGSIETLWRDSDMLSSHDRYDTLVAIEVPHVHPPEADVGAPEVRPIKLSRGDEVEAHSLQGRPELNGQIGHVLLFDEKSGRYGVKFESELTGVKLKPGNLTVLSRAAAAAAPAAASTCREICVAQFETWGAKNVSTFGNPCVVPVQKNDTVKDVRERIRQTLGVDQAEFKSWTTAIVQMRGIVQDKLKDDDVLLDVWLPRKGEHIGLKHKDPKSRMSTQSALKIKN